MQQRRRTLHISTPTHVRRQAKQTKNKNKTKTKKGRRRGKKKRIAVVAPIHNITTSRRKQTNKQKQKQKQNTFYRCKSIVVVWLETRFNGKKSTVSFDTWNFGKFSIGFLWSGLKGSVQIFSHVPKSERLR